MAQTFESDKRKVTIRPTAALKRRRFILAAILAVLLAVGTVALIQFDEDLPGGKINDKTKTTVVEGSKKSESSTTNTSTGETSPQGSRTTGSVPSGSVSEDNAGTTTPVTQQPGTTAPSGSTPKPIVPPAIPSNPTVPTTTAPKAQPLVSIPGVTVGGECVADLLGICVVPT